MSLSRIDGIYASVPIMNKAYTWDIVNPDLATADHQLVTVELHDDEAPRNSYKRLSPSATKPSTESQKEMTPNAPSKN